MNFFLFVETVVNVCFSGTCSPLGAANLWIASDFPQNFCPFLTSQEPGSGSFVFFGLQSFLPVAGQNLTTEILGLTKSFLGSYFDGPGCFYPRNRLSLMQLISLVTFGISPSGIFSFVFGLQLDGAGIFLECAYASSVNVFLGGPVPKFFQLIDQSLAW